MLDGLRGLCTVHPYNFTLQYPGILFPGKTQFVCEGDTAAKVDAEAVLSTIDPFSWNRTARIIRNGGYDLLILRYWMSWFAPSLGSVARQVKPDCKVLTVIDNALPHERHFFDKPLARWFLKAVDGCVTMSEEVSSDLDGILPGIKRATLFHPVNNGFGEKLPREEALRRLGLDGSCKTLLFFGLIREYKGLDILLDAFGTLTADYRLVIAGEPYGDFTPYAKAIEANPNRERIHLFDRYIPDSEVSTFFSAADVVVLPYRSATQSGVGAVADSFEVPMIVTDTGSLRSSVEGRGTGVVVDKAEAACVRDGILRFFGTPGLRDACIENIRSVRERLSMSAFCKDLLSFANTL